MSQNDTQIMQFLEEYQLSQVIVEGDSKRMNCRVYGWK